MSELRTITEDRINTRLRKSNLTHRVLAVGSLLFGLGAGLANYANDNTHANVPMVVEGAAAMAAVAMEKLRARRSCDLIVGKYWQQMSGGNPFMRVEVSVGTEFLVEKKADIAATHRYKGSSPLPAVCAPSFGNIAGYANTAFLPDTDMGSGVDFDGRLIMGGVGLTALAAGIVALNRAEQVTERLSQTYRTQLDNIDQGQAFGV